MYVILKRKELCLHFCYSSVKALKIEVTSLNRSTNSSLAHSHEISDDLSLCPFQYRRCFSQEILICTSLVIWGICNDELYLCSFYTFNPLISLPQTRIYFPPNSKITTNINTTQHSSAQSPRPPSSSTPHHPPPNHSNATSSPPPPSPASPPPKPSPPSPPQSPHPAIPQTQTQTPTTQPTATSQTQPTQNASTHHQHPTYQNNSAPPSPA